MVIRQWSLFPEPANKVSLVPARERDDVRTTVQNSESVQCPFCGGSSYLQIDSPTASQRFVTDCEVCCRPFEVIIECEDGEVLSIDVRGN